MLSSELADITVEDILDEEYTEFWDLVREMYEELESETYFAFSPTSLDTIGEAIDYLEKLDDVEGDKQKGYRLT